MRSSYASFIGVIAVIGLFGLFSTAGAVSVDPNPTGDCSLITHDGDTADWDNIDELFPTGLSALYTYGDTWYWDGSSWSAASTEPAGALVSLNYLPMYDLQNVKICNGVDSLNFWYQPYAPLLKYNILTPVNSYAADTYHLFEEGAYPALTLPADIDNWIAFKFTEAGVNGDIFWVTIHIEDVIGGSFANPPVIGLYQESDSTLSFEDATFDVNDDTVLNANMSGATPAAVATPLSVTSKPVDANGASEYRLTLVDGTANDFESLTGLTWGDYLEVGVDTYSANGVGGFGGASVGGPNLGIMGISSMQKIDSSGIGEVRLKKRGPATLKHKKKLRTNRRASVEWSKVSGAESYKVQLQSKKGYKLRTRTTTKSSFRFKKLRKNKKYNVRVRALLKDDTKTPWSRVNVGKK